MFARSLLFPYLVVKEPQELLNKALAAAIRCKHASGNEKDNSDKWWRYLLVSHEATTNNMTINGPAEAHSFKAPEREE